MGSREDLLLNNRFKVAIGALLISFAKASNISESFAVTSAPEGGMSYPSIIPETKKSPETLVLERGVRSDLISQSIDEYLTTGVPLIGITLMVADKSGSIKKAYFIEQGIITKWELTSLDGKDAEVLIKKLEITHTGLTQIPVPF